MFNVNASFRVRKDSSNDDKQLWPKQYSKTPPRFHFGSLPSHFNPEVLYGNYDTGWGTSRRKPSNSILFLAWLPATRHHFRT